MGFYVSTSGRVHLYEGVDPQKLRMSMYTFKLLGAETVFVTSAVGSTRPEVSGVPGWLPLLRSPSLLPSLYLPTRARDGGRLGLASWCPSRTTSTCRCATL